MSKLTDVTKRKGLLMTVVKRLTQKNEPFNVDDVLAELPENFTQSWVSRQLFALTQGSFAPIRRADKTILSYRQMIYISAKVKEPKPKKLDKGLDKEMFHRVYGCFGVMAQSKDGSRYVWNKKQAEQVRRKVAGCLMTKPHRSDLVGFVKHLINDNAGFITKQAAQIGIITALQDYEYTGQEIYGILNDVFGGMIKGRNQNDLDLRNNAANLRKTLAI